MHLFNEACGLAQTGVLTNDCWHQQINACPLGGSGGRIAGKVAINAVTIKVPKTGSRL